MQSVNSQASSAPHASRRRSATAGFSAAGSFAPEDRLKAALLLAAITLGGLEFFIPRIPLFPWLKPGLANSVTIVWLVRYGIPDTLLFSLLRIWITSFFFGFSFLTFALGAGGAICSVAAMGFLWECLGKRKLMGSIGIGIAGALMHNAGQLAVVYVLFSGNTRLLYQIPVMAGASLVFGGIVGALAPSLLNLANRVARTDHDGGSPSGDPFAEAASPPAWKVSLSAGLLGGCMALVCIESPVALVCAAAACTGAVQALKRFSARALFFPITRFWLLFLAVGALDAFFGYGMRIPWLPGVTYEGARRAAAQWLRLWTWLQTTFLFASLDLHTSLFSLLRRLFPKQSATLHAALLAVERFPAVFESMHHRGIRRISTLFRHPRHTLRTVFFHMLALSDAPRRTS
jgi:uncharacterized membrane protein